MREVDLMGFGASSFFVTYRKRRFAKWLGVSQDLIPTWLKATGSDEFGQTQFSCNDFVFKFGGRVAQDPRAPYRITTRWHGFLCPNSSGPQSSKSRYVGSFHAAWFTPVEHPTFDDIEFCFMRNQRSELRDAFQRSFLLLKLKAK